AGRNKRLPVGGPLFGPVCYDQEDIVFCIRIAQPNREAQVVTDNRTYFPAIQFNKKLLFSGGVYAVFFSTTKEVPLVIVLEASVRPHPDNAVEVLSVFVYRKTSGYYTAELLSLLQHPLHRWPVHFLCKCFWIHGKACAEHLWQNDQICLFAD